MRAGHWLLPALLGGLRVEAAAALLQDSARLYEDHERDAGDSLAAALQVGTYTKVDSATLLRQAHALLAC